MIKVQLTLGERFVLNKILNERGSNLTLMALKSALKIADKVEVSNADLKKANLKTDKQTGRREWKEKGSEKEIEFSDDEKKLLIEFFDKRDREAKYSISEGRFVISLVSKIKETPNE